MKIFKYENYDDYVQAQTEANVRKIRNVWVRESTVRDVSRKFPFASKVLCHGTRNASEQKYFKKYLPNADVLGTEISHTAEKFPMTVQHDFHETKSEWVGEFDIVYSNSFDHSYDPTKCLSAWRDQLSLIGNLFVELMTREENKSKRSDPLEIRENEFVELAESLGLTLIESFIVETKNSKVFRFKK